MTFKATLTSKGQLTLPKAVRDRFNIREGDHVLFDIHEDRIELRVVPQSSIDELFKALPRTTRPALEDAEIKQLARKRHLKRAKP